MAGELSQDMVSVDGAHADLRETRQAFRRHIELGAYLRGRESNALAGWPSWIVSKFQLTSRNWSSKWRSCKHCSSLVQWRSQKSSNAVSVSSSWPSSLMGNEGWFMHSPHHYIHLFCFLPLHSSQVLHFIMSHVVFWVSAKRLFDAVQQTATLGQRHLQILLEIKPALKKGE